jgi:hypothetical protein
MQISRTPLSCSLCRKVYETQPIGGAFDPVRSTSIYSTPSNRFRLPLPVYPLSQVLQIAERFYQTPLPPIIARGITKQLGSFAPWELPQFIATANPSATFSPSFLFPV